MSESYIKNHFHDIKRNANAIEHRLDDTYCTLERVLEENAQVLELAQKNRANYILIDEKGEYHFSKWRIKFWKGYFPLTGKSKPEYTAKRAAQMAEWIFKQVLGG